MRADSLPSARRRPPGKLPALALLLLLALPGAAHPPARLAKPDAPEALPYRALPLDERVTARGRIDGELVLVPDGPLGDESELAELITRTRAAQRYRPHPAIWRIGSRDATIYLFGTIHALPPGFRWRSAELDRVVARADALLLESVEEGGAEADALLMGGAPAAGSARLPPLIERLPPETRLALTKFQATLPNKAVTLLDAMPSWVAAMSIDYVRDLRAGDVPGPGADDWLEAHFKALHKPVQAIEDSTHVVAKANAVPEAEQRRMLEAALTAPDPQPAELNAPADAWAQGDVGPHSPLLIDLNGRDGLGPLTDPLLVDRNRAWAAALAARLKRPGTLLFAAGAAHFVGPGSVIELLRKAGIRVTRVS